MTMPNFAYVRPGTLKEAIQQLSSKGARIHAGGTDLLGCLRDGVFSAEKVVSLAGFRQMQEIRPAKEGGLQVGALATVTEVAESKVVRDRYPALSGAASEVASPQLRNQGTIGGNLCQKPRCWYYRGDFYCLRKGGDRCFAAKGENAYHCIFGSGGICYIVHPSDVAPVLVAYEARVRLLGPRGARWVPVEKLYVLPGEDPQRETVLSPNEILTHVLLPPLAAGTRSSYRKVRARQAWDFALAGVALALQVKEGRVEKARMVLSGAAPVPWRSGEAEKVLTGRLLDADTASKAAEAAVKSAEPLEQNGYKVSLFRGVIEEELVAIARV
jgi:xanthine dehydrogenase YagS FAD-binding subunit